MVGVLFHLPSLFLTRAFFARHGEKGTREIQAVYHPKSFLFALLGIAPEGAFRTNETRDGHAGIPSLFLGRVSKLV